VTCADTEVWCPSNGVCGCGEDDVASNSEEVSCRGSGAGSSAFRPRYGWGPSMMLLGLESFGALCGWRAIKMKSW